MAALAVNTMTTLNQWPVRVRGSWVAPEGVYHTVSAADPQMPLIVAGTPVLFHHQLATTMVSWQVGAIAHHTVLTAAGQPPSRSNKATKKRKATRQRQREREAEAGGGVLQLGN